MCGRFTLRSSPKSVAQEFGLFDVPDLLPRYNIAPALAFDGKQLRSLKHFHKARSTK
jgi:putative SOS response-associated peptidase YedK